MTRVKRNNCAVAARKRSAGSRWGKGNNRAASAISCVTGASRSGAVACATHRARSAGNRIRPFAFKVSASHVLIGESRSSFSGFLSLLQGSLPQPRWILQAPQPDVRIKEQLQSRSASQSLSSLAGETISPTIFIESFMEPIQSAAGASGAGRYDFRDRFSESRHANRFLSLLHLFKQRETLGLERRDGNFFHESIRP